MPYPPRLQLDAVYHVWTRATGREWFAVDAEDRRRFLRLLGRTVTEFGWSCHMYCVLGTHFHLVVRTPAANIAAGMQWLNAVYARSFNRRHERRGHLVGARYGSRTVASEEHARELCRYIPLNPVKAGLCERPQQWAWSSYAATLGRAIAPPWLETDWVLDQFGDRPVATRLLEAWVASDPCVDLEYLRGS